MERFKIFVKKNSFFVILCIVFLGIALSLTGYKLYTEFQSSQPVSTKPNQDPIDTPTTKDTPEFTNFTGEYDSTNKEVNLSWKLSTTSGLKRIRLYWIKSEGVETELLDVTNYASYALSQSAYGLTTGENTFKIKAFYEEDKVVEETLTVDLPMILSISQTENMKSNGEADVTVTYVYGKQHPVNPPKIIVNSNPEVAMTWKLVDTKTSESGDFITAKTSYHFTWSATSIIEPFNIRWYFADIQFGQDFTTTFVIN